MTRKGKVDQLSTVDWRLQPPAAFEHETATWHACGQSHQAGPNMPQMFKKKNFQRFQNSKSPLITNLLVN